MMNKNISILSMEHPIERIAARVLFGMLAFLLCGYIYFVGASILNVMARREADASATKLQSVIAGMEQQYFALSQSMDEYKARTLGLAPVSDTQYVYRPGNAAAATIHSNEI